MYSVVLLVRHLTKHAASLSKFVTLANAPGHNGFALLLWYNIYFGCMLQVSTYVAELCK